ncbi:MAG: 4a-hydroxytetrahydrobiopterin dehydratase [Ignavibacteria bacterium]|nr:4a-hydroxytetrahydrobiopterin dehydratase [Ignavibacteria bacterium]
MDKLTPEQINEALKSLPGWFYKDGSIRKVFKTKSYPATMGFVTSLGGICQKMNHHPDYVIMKYKEVEVSFSTHSAGGITQKDIEVAEELEKVPV